MLKNQDENLYSTWTIYAEYLKNSIVNKQLSKGIAFSEELKQPELAFTSSDYPLYWALIYAYNSNFLKALEVIKMAHEYGYRGFGYFDSKSNLWREDHDLLKPIHKSDYLQKYVKSVYPKKVEYQGFNLTLNPFCYFDKVILKRKNEKCHITNEKLKKGEQVYEFRYFNGSNDVSTLPHYAKIENFENDLKAKENLIKYRSNSYVLSDFAINISYNHPSLNYFWNNLDSFDLLTTLKLIANPQVNSTPYSIHFFEESIPSNYDVEIPINYGTGGEFLNLLYILVKCGYLKDILALQSQLPEHFPYLFLFFNSKEIHNKIGEYIKEDIEELSFLLDLALKSYDKKSLKDLQLLASYGKRNSNFLEKFSFCLNTYECHLYSNYQPGINWFFQDFSQFIYAKGGGLLDFFIEAPEFIFALNKMKSEECYVLEPALAAIDAYKNSVPFLYKTILLNAAFTKSNTLKKWIDLPLKIKNSEYYKQFKKVHNHTLKNLKLNK